MPLFYLVDLSCLTLISQSELSVALHLLISVSSGRYGSASKSHGTSLCTRDRQVSCLTNRLITNSIISNAPLGGAVRAIRDNFLMKAAIVDVGSNL